MHKKRNSLDGYVTYCVNNYISGVANPKDMNIETSLLKNVLSISAQSQGENYHFL